MNFRKIFFYTLVLLFFILLPLLLLHALGYRWDAKTKTLTQTGLISVKSYPEGAEVKINGKVLKKTIPASMNLVPGTYELELNLKNYWQYKKNVEIYPKKVSRLEDVLLFPKTPHFKSLLKLEKPTPFFLSPSGKRILFVSNSDQG